MKSPGAIFKRCGCRDTWAAVGAVVSAASRTAAFYARGATGWLSGEGPASLARFGSKFG
jgi:hypothetical protein